MTVPPEDRDDAPAVENGALADYKTILRKVIEQRPSGTRQRLAEALGKNRSFISQISNPGYRTPIPVAHLETIFELCHFSAAERAAFLDAYHRAHPSRHPADGARARPRTIRIDVPDLGSDVRNRELERLLREFAASTARLLKNTNRRS